VIDGEKKIMATLINEWKKCDCGVLIRGHSIVWENKEVPLKDKSITNSDTLMCPFGIFGCSQYKVNLKGQIIDRLQY
jgi:hypothetical protein